MPTQIVQVLGQEVKITPRRVIPVKDIDRSKLVFPEGKGPNFFWHQLEDGSWYSEKFGHHYPAVEVIEQEDGTLLYQGDTILLADGPCQPYQPANPGAVVVPYRIDKETGIVWVRGFLQYRSLILHPVTGKRGVVTFSIPGGYDLAGKGTKTETLRHGLEEGGAILKDPVEIGSGSSNRASIETSISIYMAEYSLNPSGRKEAAQGFESILGTYEFMAHQFPCNACFDLIVAAAFGYFYPSLGLVYSRLPKLY